MEMTPKMRQAEIERRADMEYKFTLGEGEDATEHTLKPLNTISAGFMRQVRNLDEVGQMFSLLEKLADPDTLEKLDELPRKEFNKFSERWQRWSQVTPGESSASST